MADAAQFQAAFITGAAPSLLIVVVLTFAATLVVTPASPGLAFGLVFSLLAMAYLLVSVLADEARVLVVAAVLLAVALLNSNPYKYRLPGLAWYLDHDRRPDERGRPRRVSRKKDLHRADEIIERGQIPLGPPGLLRDADVLESWRARLAGRDGREKPKLVLMTTSGGAYRAAFWTTLVLEALEEQVPGFLEHVRLMTGASGGMVGAAYVAAMMEAPGGPAGRAVLPESPTARLSAETGDDSLTAVVRELIRRDLPKAVLWSQSRDRGVVLEEQWRTLDRSFASLRDGEAAGWRPSLVLSPMVVETGRRLLFSNLDLYGLTEAQSRDRVDRLARGGRLRRPARFRRGPPLLAIGRRVLPGLPRGLRPRCRRRRPAGRLQAPDGRPDERDLPVPLAGRQPAGPAGPPPGRRRLLRQLRGQRRPLLAPLQPAMGEGEHLRRRPPADPRLPVGDRAEAALGRHTPRRAPERRPPGSSTRSGWGSRPSRRPSSAASAR